MQATTQTSGRSVGLDGHKHLVVVCIIDESGQVVLRHRCSCSRSDIEQFGRRYLQPTDKAVLEATMNTWQVVAVLKPFVAEVVVSNPLKTKAVAEAKIKTDKVDALVLAQQLRLTEIELDEEGRTAIESDLRLLGYLEADLAEQEKQLVVQACMPMSRSNSS